MRGVAKDLCWMNGEAKGRALTSVEEIIYSHAVGIDFDNSALRQRSGLQNHRKRLAELRATLRQEVAREFRINLRRDIRRELTAKLRKGEQLDRLLAGNFERGKQTLEMQLPDGPSADRHAWAAGEHDREVYRDDDDDVDAQFQRLTRLQLLAQREMAQGGSLLWSSFMISSMSSLMQKHANSLDQMVWWWRWYVLCCPTLLWLYLLFLVRLGGWETERPEAWREVVLPAIPKNSDKVGFRAMRYISLLPVLQKFYIRALQTAVTRKRKPYETNILGYEPGGSTAGVADTLRQVLSNAAEWRVGVFLASADVDGSFDCIRHEDVEKALLQKSVRCGAVCSLQRESCDLKGRKICQVIQLPLIFCMLVVPVRRVWTDQTC